MSANSQKRTLRCRWRMAVIGPGPFSCLPKMSAFGGKADIILGVSECPLIAKSGHKAEKTDGKVETEGEVPLNGERTSQTAFQTRSNHLNQVVGWFRMDGYSPGGEMLVHSPRIMSYLGNVGLTGPRESLYQKKGGAFLAPDPTAHQTN